MIELVLVFVVALAQTGSVLELRSAETFSQLQTSSGVAQELTGNVHLTQDSLDLYCQRALYYASANNALLQRNVRLTHNKLTLRSQNVSYSGNNELASSPGNLAILQRSSLLTAASGTYHVARSTAVYKDSVVVSDSSMLMSGNDMVFNRLTQYTEVFGDVRGVTSNQKFRFRGDTALYDPLSQRLELRGGAAIDYGAVSQSTTGTPSFTSIRADSIVQYVVQKDTVREVSGNVQVQHSDIVVTCGFAREHATQKIIDLFDEPMFWLQEGYGRADSIRVDRSRLDTSIITLTGSVFLALNTDSPLVRDTPYHQLQCDSLVVFSDGQQPLKVEAFQGAMSLFILVDSTAVLGRQRTVSDEIHIEFKGGEPKFVDWIGAARGEVTPPNRATTAKNRLTAFYERPMAPRFARVEPPSVTAYFVRMQQTLRLSE